MVNLAKNFAVNIFFISVMGVTAQADVSPNPDDIKQKIKKCFDLEIVRFSPTRGFSGPVQHADCRPASLPFCHRNNEVKDLSYTTSPQWRIIGQPSIHLNSVNGGYFGGPTVEAARRTVNAFAACNGRGCGGPGQWAEGYVVGTEQRIPTSDENKQVVGLCFERVFRGDDK